MIPEPHPASRAVSPPLALYVHIPWCVRKCPYCDFNSHARDGALPEPEYLAALLRDLDASLPAAAGRPLASIFIGGGTPSLLKPATIGALLDGIAARMGLAPDIEVTIEANPGTVEQGRFSGYRTAGVTRLSLGVQSLDDRALLALGRIHDAGEARHAVAAARRAGFENLNLDLMFGLPEQSLTAALEDLEAAFALEPEHLSWYQLTLEPNTPFAHAPPPLPGDDILWDMHEAGLGRIADAGYGRYEVSAFARPGRRCRHNLNYWTFGDYLGIGAGAHAKLTDPASGRVTRDSRPRHPREYLERAGTPAATVNPHGVEPAELPLEFLMNALRLTDGVPAALYGARTGQSPATLEPALSRARTDGLLVPDPERLAPTPLGLRYLNEVLLRFMGDG